VALPWAGCPIFLLTDLYSNSPISRFTSQHHTLHPEDGGSKILQNIGVLLQHCMVLWPRRPWLKSLPLWKHQMSHRDCILSLSTYWEQHICTLNPYCAVEIISSESF
jgi:hypothetical protein